MEPAAVLRRGKTAAAVLCLVVGVAPIADVVSAQELPAPARAPTPRQQVGLDAGGGQTDNLGRDSSQLRSDFRFLGLNVDAGMASRRLEGRLLSDVEWRKYGAQEVVDDHEVVGSLDGNMALHLVPQRFVWDFETNFGQLRSDPLAPSSPTNREQTAVFSTGPRIYLPAGPRNLVEIEARASERRFENSSQLDGRFSVLRLGFSHALSHVARLRVTVEDSQNELDTGDEPYDFRIASVTYERKLASGAVELTVGRGEVRIPPNEDSTEVAQFAWNRDVGTRSHLRVWAGHELTDAGEIFRLAGAPADLSGDELSGFSDIVDTNDDRLRGIVLSPSPLQRSDVGTTVEWEGHRTAVALSISGSEDDFELDPSLNNKLAAVDVYLRREFSHRWSGEIGLSRNRQDFTTRHQVNDDFRRRILIRRTFARTLQLSISGELNGRDSEIDPYDENVYKVTIGYARSR